MGSAGPATSVDVGSRGPTDICGYRAGMAGIAGAAWRLRSHLIMTATAGRFRLVRSRSVLRVEIEESSSGQRGSHAADILDQAYPAAERPMVPGRFGTS